MLDTYRPTTFDGIVGQPTDQIEALLDGKDTPNFLFYGPPGTGKTTTAHVIARRLQGSDSELMTFNASDDRGIDVVRDQIIPAADQSTLTGAPRVVFLDEMESMTKEAQQALRQPMEQSRAIFILACNELDAVHRAVHSRCQTFEFGPLSDTAIRTRIKQLADAEDVELDRDHLSMIVAYATGDMRVAIQRYQQVVRGAYKDDEGRKVQTDGNTLESDAQRFLDGQ